MAFYAGAPQRCRQGWQSAGTPPLCRLVRPPNPRAEFRICSCGGCSSRPPFAARRCCTLAGRHSGGRYASTDRVCQNSPRSLFSRHLRSFKKTNAAAPRDPSHTAMEWDGWLRVPNARVYRWSGLTPSRHAPPCCRYGETAVMTAAYNDHHAIVGKLVDARADLNTKNSLGCALPRRPVRRRSVGRRTDCACAVRQVHSAALRGGQRPHQIRRGAARRRRRPDHHGQLRVTLRRP